MDFKVDIDPNLINAEIAKQVIQSSIGEQIKIAIQRNLKSITEGYNNPIEAAVKEIVAKITMEEVKKREEEIRQIVSEKLTAHHIKQIVTRFSSWLEKNAIY